MHTSESTQIIANVKNLDNRIERVETEINDIRATLIANFGPEGKLKPMVKVSNKSTLSILSHVIHELWQMRNEKVWLIELADHRNKLRGIWFSFKSFTEDKPIWTSIKEEALAFANERSAKLFQKTTACKYLMFPAKEKCIVKEY